MYFQRVLASKDEATARQLSILAGLLCALAAVPPALIGILACGADWSARGLASPDATLVLPYVLKNLTPPFVAAIGLGAVSAAVMSSIDSSVLSASSMAAWNVYRPLVEPDASSARLTRVVKRAVIVVGIAATLMALHVRSIYTLWVLCSDLVYCILFPQLLLALNDPREPLGLVRGDGRVVRSPRRRRRAAARPADAVAAARGCQWRSDGAHQDDRHARRPGDDVGGVEGNGDSLRRRPAQDGRRVARYCCLPSWQFLPLACFSDDGIVVVVEVERTLLCRPRISVALEERWAA